MAAPDPPVPPAAPRVNLANGLTLLRLLLVPALAVQLLQGAHGMAAVLFAVSALTDALDGQVARRWHQGTRWGALADPVADKLTVLTVTGLLALQQAVPGWFALLVVARDGVIVGGALAYRWRFGALDMAHTLLSKLNTALLFLLLAGVLAQRAGQLPDGPWRPALLLATAVTLVASGGHYVLVWWRKAKWARRRAVP